MITARIACLLAFSVAAIACTAEVPVESADSEQGVAEAEPFNLSSLACIPRIDPGSCRALMPRWGYSSLTKSCIPFNYGGCGGNANRFETKEACETSCTQVRDIGEGAEDGTASDFPVWQPPSTGGGWRPGRVEPVIPDFEGPRVNEPAKNPCHVMTCAEEQQCVLIDGRPRCI